MKFKFGISSWGGRGRSRAYVFTEQGIAMLSSVLLNIAGMSLPGLGLVISFPVSLLAIAGFYRSLQPAAV